MWPDVHHISWQLLADRWGKFFPLQVASMFAAIGGYHILSFLLCHEKKPVVVKSNCYHRKLSVISMEEMVLLDKRNVLSCCSSGDYSNIG